MAKRPPTDRGNSETPDTASVSKEGTAAPSETGWLPAIVAIVLLLLMALFISCGVGTCILFRESPKLAAGTLRGHYIPLVEQTSLSTTDKKEIVSQIEMLSSQLESGAFESTQASAVMETLLRTPVIQWSDLDALYALASKRESFAGDELTTLKLTIRRLRQGVALDRIGADDLEDVLQTVTIKDSTERGCHFHLAASDEMIRRAITTGEQLADRANISKESVEHLEEVDLPDLVRVRIEKALTR